MAGNLQPSQIIIKSLFFLGARIQDVNNYYRDKGVYIDLPASKVSLKQTIKDLKSWEDAKRQMNEWVSQKPDTHVATWTYWLIAGYTIKLYNADGGPLNLKKLSGDHGVVSSESKFAYAVKF